MSNSNSSKMKKPSDIDFDTVFQNEKQKLGIKATAKATGLALSGGGIRSASFGLGVIQAFLEHGLLQKIDYLSTVSGGGYIGTSLTWNRHLASDPNLFFNEPNPFGVKGQGVRTSPTPPGQNPPKGNENHAGSNTFLTFIRQHGNYLGPSRTMNMVSAIGVALRNLLISFMIYFSMLLIAVSLWTVATHMAAAAINQATEVNSLLSWLETTAGHQEKSAATTDTKTPATPHATDGRKWMYHSFFYINLSIAAIILFLSILYGLIFSVMTYRWPSKDEQRQAPSYRHRNLFQWISGILLSGFVGFLFLALVPVINDLFTQWIGKLGILGGVSGMVAALSKFRKFLGGESLFKKASWVGDRLFEIGAFVFLFAMVVSSYHLCLKIGIPATVDAPVKAGPLIFLVPLAIFAVAAAIFVNINYASLGRMYRDRLMEAFLPDTDSIESNTWNHAWTVDSALLANMCKRKDETIKRPYHLINTNVILTNSEKERYSRRGGDSFILSPLYCGSDATGFAHTKQFMKKKNQDKGGMTLATCMAISGAAANPHTGIAGKGPTRGPLVSMLMTIFNLRLGAWVSNPKHDASHQAMNYLRPGLCSLLCFGHDENRRLLELTDGGHFENLGLYELVRRRVGTIIVADAGVDKDFKFGDLANAIQKVRTDFGVSIRFEPEDDRLSRLLPGSAANGQLSKQHKLSEKGYIEGTIKYPPANASGKFVGKIYLIKTTMVKNLPADLYSYKAQHNAFPDQPTSDQFFDEKQFEAYRELGYRLADSMCNDTALRPD